jgi:hypothetical protein
MAQQRGPGRRGGTGRSTGDAGGGRERGTRFSERGRRDLRDQEREQRDLHRRGPRDIDDIDRAIREIRRRSLGISGDPGKEDGS